MSVEEWLLFGALRLDIGRGLKVRFGRRPAVNRSRRGTALIRNLPLGTRSHEGPH